MALWGISTTSETAANNYAIPKFQSETDRNTSPWNTFTDVRGWIQRRYKTKENSGISTRYFDEVLVPVTGINSTNVGGTPGIGTAGPVAVFFEDPNQASPISVGGGGTTVIREKETIREVAPAQTAAPAAAAPVEEKKETPAERMKRLRAKQAEQEGEE